VTLPAGYRFLGTDPGHFEPDFAIAISVEINKA